MAQGCGPSCARIILIIFNIIFWLSGAALLALGLYLIFEDDISTTFEFLAIIEDVIAGASESLIHYAAYAIIAVGGLVILVGFCGCCGAIKESKCLLGTYIFFLTLIMILEFAIGGCAIYFREDMKDEILADVSETFPEEVEQNFGNDTNFREVVNFVQIEFECCGWNGMSDYDGITYAGVTGIVPSCCVFADDFDIGEGTWADITYDDAEDGAACQAMTGGYQTDSCHVALDDWIDQHAFILIGVGIGIACLELFGIIFACCLCRNVED